MNQNEKSIVGFRISDGSEVTAEDLKNDPSLKNKIIDADRARACLYDMRMTKCPRNAF